MRDENPQGLPIYLLPSLRDYEFEFDSIGGNGGKIRLTEFAGRPVLVVLIPPLAELSERDLPQIGELKGLRKRGRQVSIAKHERLVSMRAESLFSMAVSARRQSVKIRQSRKSRKSRLLIQANADAIGNRQSAGEKSERSKTRQEDKAQPLDNRQTQTLGGSEVVPGKLAPRSKTQALPSPKGKAKMLAFKNTPGGKTQAGFGNPPKAKTQAGVVNSPQPKKAKAVVGKHATKEGAHFSKSLDTKTLNSWGARENAKENAIQNASLFNGRRSVVKPVTAINLMERFPVNPQSDQVAVVLVPSDCFRPFWHRRNLARTAISPIVQENGGFDADHFYVSKEIRTNGKDCDALIRVLKESVPDARGKCHCCVFKRKTSTPCGWLSKSEAKAPFTKFLIGKDGKVVARFAPDIILANIRRLPEWRKAVFG